MELIYFLFFAATESQIPVPNCESEGYLRYLFLVRAMNLGTNNVTHYGNWSSPGETNCYSSGNKIPLIIPPWSQGLGISKQSVREDFEIRMGIEATQDTNMEVLHGFEGGEIEGSGLLQEFGKDIDFEWYCTCWKHAYSKHDVKRMCKLLFQFLKYVTYNK
jgi:hypothetical protein